jgi:hypothetical protein
VGDIESSNAHYPVEHADEHLELAVLVVVEYRARIHFWMVSRRKRYRFLVESSKHGFHSGESFLEVSLTSDRPMSARVFPVFITKVVHSPEDPWI